MTNKILERIADERELGERVCGRCSRWGNKHIDNGRPVYTLSCDLGKFTRICDTCPEYTR